MEQYGDAVENNRRVNEEALRRAHNRGVNETSDETSYSDMLGEYSEPEPAGVLNNGELTGGPTIVGENQPKDIASGICGVEEIARWTY